MTENIAAAPSPFPEHAAQPITRSWLTLPGLAIASVSAIVVALSTFIPWVHWTVVRPLTYVTGAMAAILFVRAVFDMKVQKGVAAFNRELRRRKSLPFWSLSRWRDTEWGIFGSRYGKASTLAIRAAVLAEFVVACVASGPHRDILLLSFAATFTVTMLLILHVGLNTQASQEPTQLPM